MQSTLSWDEVFQILLFLPVSDVCLYSQTNSIAYDNIRRNQHLWKVLLRRDFRMEHFQEVLLQSTLTATTKPFTMSREQNSGCDELRDYMCLHVRFCRFQFNLVESPSRFEGDDNCTMSKVTFGVISSRLNQSVIDTLKNRKLEIQQDDSLCNRAGVKFRILYMASIKAKTIPNLMLQFWIPGRGLGFQEVAKIFYRETQCLVIAVDPRHAWNEASYSTDHPSSNIGTNSMSRALAALKESQPHLKFEPPMACKAVIIIGVGGWPEGSPISKQRFLNDCAQVFDIMPLEYFELNYDNATVMSDMILSRFCTCHREVTLEDALLT